MEEFFVNDFVIKVETGHPGYIDYKIIATPTSLRVLVDQLAEAAARLEAAGDSQGYGTGASPLLHKYATVSGGQTSRVTISFHAARDLTAHHVRPTRLQNLRNNLSCLLLLLAAAGIVYLAGVGAAKLLGELIGAS